MLGVITGCDKHQEWLLPWWWDHYSRHNHYPVLFADFGMSKKALEWCQEKGNCITVTPTLVNEESISPSDKQKWENRYGKGIWFCRSTWFKKPLALLNSPFSTGIWIDLDCEVRNGLDPLFHSLAFGGEMALVSEPSFIQSHEKNLKLLLPEEHAYNSGVIVFRPNTDIIHDWIKESSERGHLHAGDQQALSRSIYNRKNTIVELPNIYNWGRVLGENPQALIYHFTGGVGKMEILRKVKPNLIPLMNNIIYENNLTKKTIEVSTQINF